jgi:hypothetical protein
MIRASRREAKRTGAFLIYLLLLVSLQVFLMVVAVEGVLDHDAGLAWAAALLSVGLFASAIALRWFLGGDCRGWRRTTLLPRRRARGSNTGAGSDPGPGSSARGPSAVTSRASSGASASASASPA